ncbi:MAG: YCF48-related protein [Flavobacteriales bacterium]|nr:YCF48-related protein [Flavobacteriales bacterium]
MKKIYLVLALFSFAVICNGQWVTLNSGTTDNLNTVHFVNDNIGYAAGDGTLNATILKTVNGGASWTAQNISSVYEIESIFFVNQSKGFALNSNNDLYKTTDGGNTWTYDKHFWGYSGKVYFLDAQTGFLALSDGGQGIFHKTVDGGNTWLDSVTVQGMHNVTSIQFVNSSVGYSCSFGGMVAKTTDGGATWNQVSQPTSNPLRDVYFTSTSAGYVVGSNSGNDLILRTTDGGVNWTQESTNATFSSFISAIDFTPSGQGYCAGGDVYMRSGSVWNEMNAQGSINDMHFPSDNVGYIVGYNGYIAKLVPNANPCNLTVSQTVNSNQIYLGDNIFFSANASSNNVSYQWQSDLGLGFQDLIDVNQYSGANSSQLDVSSIKVNNHKQPFRVIVDDGICQDTSNIENIIIRDSCLILDTIVLRIMDDNDIAKLKIYPNPSHSEFYIQALNFNSSDYTIYIENVLGEVVFNELLTNDLTIIDLKEHSNPGPHFLRLFDQNGTMVLSKKLILN